MKYSIRPDKIYKILKSDIPIESILQLIDDMHEIYDSKICYTWQIIEQIEGSIGLGKKKIFKNKTVSNFVEKNLEILEKVKDSGLFYTIVFDYQILNNYEEYKNFLSYVNQKLKENKVNIMAIFEKIITYDVFSFDYTDEKLSGREYITVKKNFFDETKYEISGIITDGKMVFLNTFYKGTYPVIVSDANFIISYDTSSMRNGIRSFIIRNLDFDASLLPDKDVILDSTKAPDIDLEGISERNDAMDSLYALKELIMKTESNLRSIEKNEICEIKDRLLPIYKRQIEELNEERNRIIAFLKDEKGYTEEIINQGIKYLDDMYFSLSIDVD